MNRNALFGGALMHAGLTASALAGPLDVEQVSVYSYSVGYCTFCYDIQGFAGDPDLGWNLATASAGPTEAWASGVPASGDDPWRIRLAAKDSYAGGYFHGDSQSFTILDQMLFTVTEPYWLTATWSSLDRASSRFDLTEDGSPALRACDFGSGTASIELVPGRLYSLSGAAAAGFGESELIITFTADPICRADFNSDTLIDFNDVALLVTYLVGDDLTADLNNDCRTDYFDVQAFLIAYHDGCP